jgi:peptide/nickel transport system substrate-binding protein
VDLQHRVSFAAPKSVLDVRVRRALAFALDQEAVDAAQFNGDAILADSFVPPTVDYFAQVDAAVVKYPYDARRAEALMNDVGYRKGADGVYVHPRFGRFVGDLRGASAQAENELNVMAELWRREGFELTDSPLSPAQTRSSELRSTFPTLYLASTPLGPDLLNSFASAHVAARTNGWSGQNRGGWTSEDYDRLFDDFSQTLDRGQRARLTVDMAKLTTDSVAAISLYFNPGVVAYATGLKGPQPASPGTDPDWNIHEWEWAG